MAPGGHGGPVAGDEVALHARPAEIDVTMLQTDVFRDVDPVFDHEGRGLGGIQDAQLVDQDFDCTGGQVGVDHVGRPAGHHAPDADDIFVSDNMGLFMDVPVVVGVEDHLGESEPVPQIDKDNPAMIPAVLDPAGQPDFPADHVGGQGVAVVRPSQVP